MIVLFIFFWVFRLRQILFVVIWLGFFGALFVFLLIEWLLQHKMEQLFWEMVDTLVVEWIWTYFSLTPSSMHSQGFLSITHRFDNFIVQFFVEVTLFWYSIVYYEFLLSFMPCLFYLGNILFLTDWLIFVVFWFQQVLCIDLIGDFFWTIVPCFVLWFGFMVWENFVLETGMYYINSI